MIYIAGDHYTVELIDKIKKYLTDQSIDFENLGSQAADQKVQLQQTIPAVTTKVLGDLKSSGILACGTGTGVEIGANRFAGIRASLCRDAKQAEYARVYDNANILCLGSWLTKDPVPILKAWLNHSFDNNESRAKMIKDFDSWH